MTIEKHTKTKIKICGLRRREDILAVNEAKPDYCGFIIEFPRSFRSITADKARELVRELSPKIRAAGVFVNAPMELVRDLLNDGTLALAQLHGQEDESYIRELKKTVEKPVIKAFSVKIKEDIEKAILSPADYILLDQGGGGTGKTFDWSLIPEIRREFFLAGGLGAENLRQAIREIGPYAVDLSSSVETDKWKDPEKIRQVVDIVKKSETFCDIHNFFLLKWLCFFHFFRNFIADEDHRQRNEDQGLNKSGEQIEVEMQRRGQNRGDKIDRRSDGNE